MAHSYHHALSSVHRWGGVAEDYVAIHEWFDASKAILADFRHRSLRHHTVGIDECVRTFGSSITNKDGASVEVLLIACQHCREDFGHVPEFSSWAAAVSPADWMTAHKGSFAGVSAADMIDIQSKASAARWGGEAADYAPLHAWIDEFNAFDDVRNGILRHHAQGAFEAQTVFGQTITNRAGRAIPVRLLVEQHLTNDFGHIPSFGAWVGAMHGRPWMMKAQPLSRTVDPFALAS